MDCSIQPLRHNMSMISTTDFFYPLVDDPYKQGKIGAANVLSDLYAMGVVNCDNMLMILSVSSGMKDDEKDIVTKKMIEGFNDTAREAGTEIRGGQTVVNPWPIIGGVAMSCCTKDEFIYPTAGCVGDFVVLTKPLGTQVSVNLNEWIQDKSKYWDQVKDIITPNEVFLAYQCSEKSMVRLNRNAAVLMHKYKAHGATDITGFGIMGHATNLATNQDNPVDIEIHTLPIIQKMAPVSNKMGFFKLLEGYSAETSGGLFIMLPSEESAIAYCKELEEIDGLPCWIVGRVVEAQDPQNPKSYIKQDFNIIDVLY
jgi:selenide,water dikinase